MTHEAHQHQHHYYTVGWRRRMTFWAIAVVLCLIGALLSLGIQFLFDSVGKARHLRYEPADVPPQEISPENKESERRTKEKKRGL